MDFSVQCFGQKLKNPLIAASGCFGFGQEATEWQDVTLWGAICSKGVTREPRLGNPSPRVIETASGMLNSVGLQNPGIEVFQQEILPQMKALGTEIIVNIAGRNTEDYLECAQLLESEPVLALEINLSCPNVTQGCMSMGTDAQLVRQIISEIKKVSRHPLIAKLTPNVSHIAEIAAAAEEGGADAISLVNTFLGMAVDLHTRRPCLKNNTGGLSGPAIKAIALRMVHEVCQVVDIPVIGLGGIVDGRDVLEYILVGATAVEVGTANFLRPCFPRDCLGEMKAICESEGISSLDELRGSFELWPKS
ncbi:MAG: dihydroorotate dehydrogenase [Clostridiales bacterium]|nr:dihydroorotate dehydrogenase [Clostridiales bacterium]MDD7432244.1 dihydroorotate dehydrogenase [Clostridiales bacterium]MDY3062218.1 dihydroorotate dehydrogenase [Eubacteriales bacterium]